MANAKLVSHTATKNAFNRVEYLTRVLSDARVNSHSYSHPAS